MAKSDIPDPLRRRHLIEQDLTEVQSLEIADAYLAADRVPESLAFLIKAGARERIEALIDRAVSDGDTFLLKQLADAASADPGTARWLAAADAAEAAGKLRYAEMARRHARSSEE